MGGFHSIRIRYRRVFPPFILPFSRLNDTAGLPKMLPRLRFIVAIGGELYFFTHSASTRAHISDWPVAVHFVSMWSIVSVRIHVYSGV